MFAGGPHDVLDDLLARALNCLFHRPLLSGLNSSARCDIPLTRYDNGWLSRPRGMLPWESTVIWRRKTGSRSPSCVLLAGRMARLRRQLESLPPLPATAPLVILFCPLRHQTPRSIALTRMQRSSPLLLVFLGLAQYECNHAYLSQVSKDRNDNFNLKALVYLSNTNAFRLKPVSPKPCRPAPSQAIPDLADATWSEML